jgi:hypothetical protein
MSYFYAIILPNDDNCFSGICIVFGTQENIDNDCLTFGDLPYDKIQLLGDLLEDTGESCEDYAIVSTKKENQIPAMKSIIEKMGFIENNKLQEVGWG